ncbi:MAG: pimeloyl-ACP methyl ester carboxylesterase [Saprospiraceae bacterium]|jgi:pimeloyl-ACP methyl ester carboxylesterase
MNHKLPFEELSYGKGERQIQFLHANAHVPETYRKLLKNIGFTDFKFLLPHQRPIWPNSDPRELKHWSLLAKDIIAHMDASNRKGVIGIGHSMGAIATWFAAVERPDLFSELVLIDPVILAEQWVKRLRFVPYWMQKRWIPFVKIAVNRRDHWPDLIALESHLGSKKVYKRFDPEVWEDFKKYAVMNADDGSLQLRYPKAWEAKVYGSAPNLWPLMKHNPCPITIIKAEYSDVITPEIWDRIHVDMPHAELKEIKHTGHLVPFENPAALASMIKEILN